MTSSFSLAPIAIKTLYNTVSYPLSFFFMRVNTPLVQEQNTLGRYSEAALFGIVASGVQFLVEAQKLNSYLYGYLPAIFSYSYNDQTTKNTPLKLVMAASATLAAASSIYSNEYSTLLTELATYTTLKVNEKKVENYIHKSAFYGLSYIIAQSDKHIFTNSSHPITFTAIGATVFFGLNEKYSSKALSYFKAYEGTSFLNTISYILKPEIAVAGGVVAGLAVSNYERDIIDHLFSPSSFNEAYQVVSKYIPKEALDLALEKHFTNLANLQIGIGFYGNYLLINSQAKTNALLNIEEANSKKFEDFVIFTAKYLLIAASYSLNRVGVDAINAYSAALSSSNLLKNFINENALNKQNYLRITTANHTIDTYFEDFSTSVKKLHEVIAWYLFGLPKLSCIYNLDSAAYFGLGLILGGDAVVNKILQVLQTNIKSYKDDKTKATSSFSKVVQHDNEYATTILLKDGLEDIKNQWNNLVDSITKSDTGIDMNTRMLETAKGFYDQDILYPLIHIIVAFMRFTGQISSDEIFLYTRTIQTLTDSLLFKSKNKVAFNEVKSAIERLEELHKHLYADRAEYPEQIEHNNNGTLVVKDLKFSRGSNDQMTDVSIQDLVLESGNIYAITGPNGSGKTSSASLLQFILSGVYDPSYTIKTVNISYPSTSMGVITQKDYVPFDTSLMDLVMFPRTISFVSNETRHEYETKIVENINLLKVFRNPIEVSSLYERQESWKDLSGGQKKKLSLVHELITCPKLLVMDEVFGPLDSESRSIAMDLIKDSCLSESLILVVWHQDKNLDNTSCVIDPFFDYELHFSRGNFELKPVTGSCSLAESAEQEVIGDILPFEV